MKEDKDKIIELQQKLDRLIDFKKEQETLDLINIKSVGKDDGTWKMIKSNKKELPIFYDQVLKPLQE